MRQAYSCRILVNPADLHRAFTVFADVANELTLKSHYGSEDAARNHVALDFGNTDFELFDQVEVGRDIVDRNRRVSLKELKKFFRLLRTRVIDNEVDLAIWRLTRHDLCKEVDELPGLAACARWSKHLFRLGVQSAVQSKGTTGAAGRKREFRVQEVERLDGALLVHAESRSVRRVSNVQSDDVGSFPRKPRIVTGHVDGPTRGAGFQISATLD